MAETTATAAATKKPKAKPTHPKTSKMVEDAIKALKDRKGSSLAAIKKHIVANNKVDADKIAPFVRRYIKKAVADGTLVQTKGTGANGSFKIAAPAKEAKVAKKPAAAKPKTKKKPAAAKKAPAKKSASTPKKKKKVVKKTATKSKKEKKPAKSPKKPKAPKPKKAAASKPKAKKAAPKKK